MERTSANCKGLKNNYWRRRFANQPAQLSAFLRVSFSGYRFYGGRYGGNGVDFMCGVDVQRISFGGPDCALLAGAGQFRLLRMRMITIAVPIVTRIKTVIATDCATVASTERNSIATTFTASNITTRTRVMTALWARLATTRKPIATATPGICGGIQFVAPRRRRQRLARPPVLTLYTPRSGRLPAPLSPFRRCYNLT